MQYEIGTLMSALAVLNKDSHQELVNSMVQQARTAIQEATAPVVPVDGDFNVMSKWRTGETVPNGWECV
jgi:hypothetical protein